MKRFWGILLFLAGGAAACLAILYMLWQDDAVRRFIPVDCQILSAEVKRHSGKHTTYSPEITYRYTYQGKPYESTSIFPVNDDGDSAWATRIVNHFGGPHPRISIERPQYKTTAYINPHAPHQAILIREYSFTPYVLSLLALLVTAVGLGLVTGVFGNTRTSMTAIPLGGAFLLLPEKSLRTRFTNAAGWLIGFVIVIAPPSLHWTFVAQQSRGGIILYSIEGAIGLVILIQLFRRWSVARHISDARLSVKPAPMIRGQPFTLDLEADAYTPLRVTQARARVICVEHYKERRGNKTQYGTRIRIEKKAILSEAVQLPAGQVLAGKGELLFDTNDPPTTDLVVKIYPYYTWEIRVEIDLEGAVDYRATFPLKAE